MVFIVGGLIILPSWPGEWLTNVELYMQEVSRVYLFHYFVVFLLVLCRQPWVLCLALAQVCFFPIVDIYGSLPLLFGIFCFRLPVALTLSGITWLMPFAYGDPNSSSSLLLFVLGPYLVVALLVSAGNLKRYQAIRGWLLRDELNCLYT